MCGSNKKMQCSINIRISKNNNRFIETQRLSAKQNASQKILSDKFNNFLICHAALTI